MIVPQTPEEAQEWITNFCAQVLNLDNMARQMAEFAAVHYTEENRQTQDTDLIQGVIKDEDGNDQQVTWTSDQLRRVTKAFDTATLFRELMQRKGGDGKPVIAAFQAQVRPIMQRRQIPQ